MFPPTAEAAGIHNRERTMKTKIYLCGPITGCNDAEERFRAAEAFLTEARNMDVYSPMAVTSALPKKNMSRKDFMDLGLHLLSMCDAIAVMPGCEGHTGCDLELAYARACGYPIKHLTENAIREGMELCKRKAKA